MFPNVFTSLWLKNGCPTNILICDQNLGCFGELRTKRFGFLDSPSYDGLHLRGPLGNQHYTISVLRIFKELFPSLQSKPFPKISKPHQQKTTNARPLFPSHSPASSHLPRKTSYNSRCFDNRRNGETLADSGEHWDCPQAQYQFQGQPGFSNHGPGFTIPTQNRFSTFYNNQGN